jgi:NitT/TauT family transport system substrate-binding protein
MPSVPMPQMSNFALAARQEFKSVEIPRGALRMSTDQLLRGPFIAATLGVVLLMSTQASRGQTNVVRYDEIAAKAKQAEGPAVAIASNYFLAWTGAWDSVILREREIWKKWLPAGSTVEWKRNLIGPPVITELLAGKQQLGYIGDNPSILSITKRDIAELDLVAINTTSPTRMCGNIIVRKDAPPFAGYNEALQWLQGKTLAAPKGSCADRLGQIIVKRAGITVNWQQLAPEITITGLEAGKIDAAVMFEPYASKALFDGVGRFAVSPAIYGETDANGIIVRRDFIDKNRAAVVAWLKADIEALLFVHDNPVESVHILKKQLPEYTRENLWFAVYGSLPPETGAPSGTVLEGAFIYTPAVKSLIDRVGAFLFESRITQSATLPPGAVREDLVNIAFQELGLDPTKALFQLAGASHNPFTGDDLVK